MAGTSKAEQNVTVGVAWEKRGVALGGVTRSQSPSLLECRKEPALGSLQSVGFRFCFFELGGSSRWLGQGECSVSQGRGFSILPARRRAHRQYMLSGQHHDFPLYRNVVHEVTQVFAAASREVLAVEAELAGPRAQPVLARHVRNLQELEQTRLATVRPPLTFGVTTLSFGVGNGSHPNHYLYTCYTPQSIWSLSRGRLSAYSSLPDSA